MTDEPVLAPLGLVRSEAYAENNGFLHFEDVSKKLDVGVGFWIRK